MRLVAAAVGAAERIPLPDSVMRAGIAALVGRTARRLRAAPDDAERAFAHAMQGQPIALFPSDGDTAAEGDTGGPVSGPTADTPTGDISSTGGPSGGTTGATAPIDTVGDGTGGDGCQCGSSSAPLTMSALFFLPFRRRRR